jgi:hypothetical protein
MQAFGEQLQTLGAQLVSLGMAIIPFSFAAFPFVRWLEYALRWGYTRLVKAIWYLTLGLSYVVGAVEVEALVVYICFIEAFDLVFEHFEKRRERLNQR